MPNLSTNAPNLTFTAANQQWIVQSGVVVGMQTTAVIMPFANDELVNNGMVFVPEGVSLGRTAVDVRSGANGAIVVNSETGWIAGFRGILAIAALHVTNAGSIVASGIGIDYYGVGSELDNSGHIYGKAVAVKGTLISDFTLTNSGVIESDRDAIVLVGDKMVLTNTGKIKGGDGGSALVAHGTTVSSTVQLVNQGVIQGKVHLSEFADTFNGRGGVTKGVVFGRFGNDSLTGGGGEEELHGDNGQDTISGRGGHDILVGGAAGDTLKGSGGSDDFLYKDVLDSIGNSASSRDTILDFEDKEDDRIDLRPLDAKLGTGNQKFVFIGTDAFTGHKGELRYDVANGDAVVQADVTGDGNADMAILVNNLNKLTADDFNL